MTKLRVLTFTDKPLPPSNKLVESCKANELELGIISPESEWKVNAQKIKLLYDHLHQLPDNLIILVVDAFDVYINAGEKDILKSFQQFSSDIVFSSEANFYFRNPKLKGYYLKNYPTSPTLYRYLNSGTFIGYVWAIRQMLSDIISDNQLNPDDMDSFIPVRSDQYLYGKHFVDQSIKGNSSYRMTLDYQHELMEVSGGRMRLMKLPHLSKLHAFNSYKIERFLVKLLGLNAHQNRLVDLKYHVESSHFNNTVTNTNPTIIHIPGSWKSFDEILNRLMKNQREATPLFPLLWLIGGLAYLVSLLVPVRINY